MNRNHAISLENHVKIKYVNIKNAVDYTCEKYHARNSQELEYVFEQYQDEAREKEKFRKTSDDLDYYSKSLIQYLMRLRMYAARVWINHPIADMKKEARKNVDRIGNCGPQIEAIIRKIESINPVL